MNERTAMAMSRAVTARMRELELSQAELVRRSGLSEPTVNSIVRGASGGYRDATLARLVAALGWTTDSVDHLRSGRAPIVSPVGPRGEDPPRQDDPVAVWAAIRRIERRVEALAADVSALRRNYG
jgi:transcriptional regulator with XRE-family HTH domain